MITFDQAVFELQRQSIARGFGGDLSDVSVTLCEDAQTVSVWSHYHLDEPLMTLFDLPQPVKEFDAWPYVSRLLDEGTQSQLRRSGVIPDMRA